MKRFLKNNIYFAIKLPLSTTINKILRKTSYNSLNYFHIFCIIHVLNNLTAFVSNEVQLSQVDGDSELHRQTIYNCTILNLSQVLL